MHVKIFKICLIPGFEEDYEHRLVFAIWTI